MGCMAMLAPRASWPLGAQLGQLLDGVPTHVLSGGGLMWQ